MSENYGQPRNRQSAALYLLLFLVFGGCALAVGIYSYRSYARQFRTEADRQLAAVTDLKVNQLERWRTGRILNGASLQNREFFRLVSRLFACPEDAPTRLALMEWMNHILKWPDLDRVSLVDAQGVEWISEPIVKEKEPSCPELAKFLAAPGSDPVFLDFHRHGNAAPIHLGVAVPLFDPDDPNRCTGALVLQIDPEAYLYPMIRQWPTASPTAETLLVRRDGDDVLFLNNLRFHPDAALNLRIPLKQKTVPAVMAILGQRGTVEGQDYRDVPVVACVRPIADSPWYLVARMDRDEVYKPLHDRARTTVFLVLALLFAAGSVLALLWRRQRMRYYRQEARLVAELRTLSARLETILATVPDIIMEVDNRKIYTWANRAGLDFFGEDAVGKEAAFFFEGEQETNKTVAPLFEGGKEFIRVESWQRRKDGQTRLLEWWCCSRYDEHGHVTGALSSARDITELNDARAALESVARELREKNTELERFLYTASHDLKSPVVTVRTFLGYLEHDMAAARTDRVETDLGYIRGAAEKMTRLLDDLLSLSRIGRVVSPPSAISFHALVAETLTAVGGHLSERGVRTSITGSDTMLFGDRIRLAEIWQNLTENAIKFMGDQAAPCIVYGADERDGEIRFSVRDNGVGIEARHMSKIFELFEKLNPKVEGTGIGLAIVKRIVELYGGRIWVESEGPGSGSAFFFTLPGARGPANQTERAKK